MPRSFIQLLRIQVGRQPRRADRGLLITLLLLSAPGAAWAAGSDREKGPEQSHDGQEAQGDIVVTAQRRESRIQDTPLAVNALGSDELAERGFRRLNDLAGLAAGVNIPNQSQGTQAVFVRGIGTTRPIANPSVGVYIDDIYIPRAFGTGWYGALPDIDRIEILHGPQGTLYGQNSSAGALKFVTKTPGDRIEASAELGYGNYDAFDARAYLSVPLGGDLSFSLAGAHLRRDGVDYNATLGRDTGALSNDQIRGILRYAPGETEILLSGDYMRDRSEYRTSSPTNLNPGVRVTLSDIDPKQAYDGGGVTLRISHPLGDTVTLRSITGYRSFRMNLPTDTDGQVGYISGFDQDLDQNQISQEFQLIGDFERFSLTAGALAYRENFHVYRLSWSRNAFSVIQTDNRTTSLGAYAQGDYKLTDKLTATVGLRFSFERNQMDALGYASNINGDRLTTTYDVRDLKKDFTSVLPRLGLSYKFNPDVLAYAVFAQGRTSGGWNTAPGNGNVARIPIGQEKVTSYEAGLKAGTADKVLQGSLAVFYNDYSDYQASITNPVIDGQIITGSVLQNAGDAHIYGAELELTARPTSRFDARFSFTYLESAFDTYQNPTGAVSSNYVGEDLSYVPKFSGGASLGYTVPFRGGGRVRARVTGRIESSSYSTLNPTREQNKFPEQHYVDATLSATLPGGNWTLSIEGKNVFDKTFVLPVSGAWAPGQGLYGVGYSQPRTVVGRIGYQF